MHLRLIEGTWNVTRHGTEAELRAAAETSTVSFGPLAMPKSLRGQAAYAWKRYIAPAGWLDASREPAAIAFCELWSELRSAPTVFPAAKHTQMRAYMADLGLTDDRARQLGHGKIGNDEFFDD